MLKVLDNKWTTIILLLTFILLMLFGYSLAHLHLFAQTLPTNQTGTEPTTIVYLVSSDREQIEDELKPQALLDNSALLEEYSFTIQIASDWKTITHLLRNHQLDILILHYSAVDLVNLTEIRNAINQGVIIAGIGIPGLELAELVGEPALFTSTWRPGEGYMTPYYFYIYSYGIKGDQIEMDRLRASGWQLGEDPPSNVIIQKPIIVNYHASTDTLLGKDFSTMFSLIYSHSLPLSEANTETSHDN